VFGHTACYHHEAAVPDGHDLQKLAQARQKSRMKLVSATCCQIGSGLSSPAHAMLQSLLYCCSVRAERKHATLTVNRQPLNAHTYWYQVRQRWCAIILKWPSRFGFSVPKDQI